MNGSEMASALERVFLDSGHFDLSVLTPGSPAYVRRLRDQAAVAVLGGLTGDDVPTEVRAEIAVLRADFLIDALGYRVPEDERVKS